VTYEDRLPVGRPGATAVAVVEAAATAAPARCTTRFVPAAAQRAKSPSSPARIGPSTAVIASPRRSHPAHAGSTALAGFISRCTDRRLVNTHPGQDHNACKRAP
jgi:hypothetical protein